MRMSERQIKPPLDPKLLAYARGLRHDHTDAEHRLWQLLRNRQLAGCKFRRQVPIAGFIVDFFCAEEKVAVELDGSQHMQPKEAAYDEGRTAALAKVGVRIVRFWDNEVFDNVEGVLQHIYDHLASAV